MAATSFAAHTLSEKLEAVKVHTKDDLKLVQTWLAAKEY